MRIPKIERFSSTTVHSDGALAHPDIGDGRIIPVAIIDCKNDKKLYELILLHEHTPPGDVCVTWARDLMDSKHVYLKLEFELPMKHVARIRFALSKHTTIVDGAIRSRGLYLQPMESGTKVIDGLAEPKILIEIPSSATFPDWPKIHRKVILKEYREQGASQAEAKELAEQHLERLAEIWKRRVGQQRANNDKNIKT